MNRSVPPEKETGAVSHAPIPKPAGKYQQCQHNATHVQQMAAAHPHHAAERCADCGAFLRWLPRPETLETRRLNAFHLAKLSTCDALTPWQRDFMRDVSQRKTLSPRQQAIIDELAAKYVKGTAV